MARGVARKDERLEDVERVVKEQLLPPAGQDEPLLNHVATLLRGRSAGNRQALKVLRKLASGAKVRAREDSIAQRRLLLAGIVRVDQEAASVSQSRLQGGFRCALVERRAAGGRESRPSLLVVAIAAGLGAYWYHEYLPRPYVRALTAPTADFAPVESAYRSLRRLPGFAAQADQLFAAALERRGTAAVSFGDIAATRRCAAHVLGRDALADQLLADFWLRQSLAARKQSSAATRCCMRYRRFRRKPRAPR